MTAYSAKVESSWSVEFTASARQEFRLLSEAAKRSAVEAILDVAENPLAEGTVALRGYAAMYRVRFGEGRYRLIYHVSVKQRRIIITRIRPRGTAYIGMRGGD